MVLCTPVPLVFALQLNTAEKPFVFHACPPKRDNKTKRKQLNEPVYPSTGWDGYYKGAWGRCLIQ